MRQILILIAAVLFSLNGMAQQKFNGHKPVGRTEAEKKLSKERAHLNLFKSGLQKKFPSSFIMPGEFEESQAVAISWSFEYDNDGNVIGADTSSEYGLVSALLADAIQKECKVIIRVDKAVDTIPVISFMNNRNTPLYNYLFMVAKGDDWWTRDYGPMAFYNNTLDTIAFTDMKYYDGRDNDNLFPAQLAAIMGKENYITSLNAEGGNLMTDGFGKMFFSDVVTWANNDILGWSTQTTYDTLQAALGTPDLKELIALECDGGTGHIDLYVKLIDEQTMIMSQYPSEITAQDRQIIEDNFQAITNMTSTYNRPFRILRVEHPTNDVGKHSRKSCTQLDADARNFINGLTVNNSFIFPSYYDGNTGNKEQHERIMDYYKRTLPGYKIVPIDSRDLSPLGGAIHCITMQIPAENPIRFWHPSVDGIQANLPSYHIIAKISNSSGIKTAKCIWRKNSGAWTSITLNDSAGYFIGDIIHSGLNGDDYIEYYLEAESYNGKTANKPITAKNGGYYKIRLRIPSGTEDDWVKRENHLFTAYPNPAKEFVNINFQIIQQGDIQLNIYDGLGKLVYTESHDQMKPGVYTSEVNIESLPQGIYYYSLLINHQMSLSKKLRIDK
ncbi:MAG: agmatine deiminase family protein [Bacteroidia bacterium]